MKTLKHMIPFLFSLLLCCPVLAQEDITDKLSLGFSDPSKPGTLEASLMRGSITVTGYEGNKVLIEAKTRLRKLDDETEEAEETKKKKEKGKGMFRIPITTSELSVEENNNHMEIDVESYKKTVDLTIRVPIKTSLILGVYDDGDIIVDNVTGDIEVENHHGGISLTDISGSVVANTYDKDLTVQFNQVAPDKAMSFSTFHGDLDITFPTTVNAKIKIKTERGEVYSDFKIIKMDNPKRIIEEDNRNEGGSYNLSIENAFWGKINNGGPEIQFTTYDGDIYIRKQ